MRELVGRVLFSLLGKNKTPVENQKTDYKLNHIPFSENISGEQSPTAAGRKDGYSDEEKYTMLMEMKDWNEVMRGMNPSNPSISDFPYLKQEDLESGLNADEAAEKSFERAMEALKDYSNNLLKINRERAVRELGGTPEELAERYRLWRLERIALRLPSYMGRGYVHAEKYLEEAARQSLP